MKSPLKILTLADEPPALAACRVRVAEPEWRPLLEIAGAHTQDFVWMARLVLEDGTRLEAYKHRHTRRYLQLTLDGDAYAYLPDQTGQIDGPDRYRKADRVAALEYVFRDWHELNAGASDYEEMCRALEQVMACAASGLRTPYDPEWLARQERYEAAVQQASEYERQHDPRHRGEGPRLPGDDFVGDLDDVEALGNDASPA